MKNVQLSFIYKDIALEDYFKKVDSISSTIEGMESSVEYLDIIMNRIGIFLYFYI